MSTSGAAAASAGVSPASAPPAAEGAALPADPLLQYVVLREDLWKVHAWPLGSVAAQGAHAAVRAVWESKDDPDTRRYCSPDAIGEMRKVVLQVADEAALRALATALSGAGVKHTLWTEQPEDEATALATAPALKSAIGEHLRNLKLCRAAIGGNGKK